MDPAFSSWPTGSSDPHPQVDALKEKPKKPRHRHSASQLAALNELYDRNEHPSLDQRTTLAEHLGMETKTVNAWFQNKRAANKKRSRPGQAPSTYDLPPISSLLSPVDSSTAPLVEDPPTSEFNSPSRSRMQDHPPHISRTQASPETSLQQSAFYAGNPEHDHTYDSSVPELPPRPRIRTRPSPAQTEELRKAYSIDPHPTKEQREELGKRIGMRYQSVTNWFQNQRSLAKKRLDDDASFDKTHHFNSGGHPTADLSTDVQPYSRDVAMLETPAFPPRSSHPPISPALTRRERRSPSIERSNASTSSRGSPYHSLIPPHRLRRTRPARHQLEALQKLYNRTSNPSIEERVTLAHEVGMDLAKVTNWFRNLRQTTRKRAQKPSEEGDVESMHGSGFISRAVTPSAASSYSVSVHEPGHAPDPEHDIDTDAEDASVITMNNSTRKPGRVAPSDAGTDDEEYQEAVTPSPEPSPLPHPPTTVLSTSRPHQIDVRSGININPIDYDRLEKIPGRLSGVRVEDALLLLGFHHHIVH